VPKLATAFKKKKGAAPKFPLKLAGIDIGSNAIRLLVAEFDAEGRYQVVESDRVPVRLGHDVFVSGRLKDAAIEAALEGLRRFMECCERHSVHALRVVATSAIREADNGDVFCARIREGLGLDVEVISGGEEARLVHTAIKNKVPLGRSRWISIDIGGGSVEVSLVDSEGIILSESHPVGSVRLLEELSGHGGGDGNFKRLLTEYIGNLKLPAAAQRYKPAGVIATGGNIDTLAKLICARSEPRIKGTDVIPLSALRATIELISGLSYKQRIEQLDLRSDRADVILPAAIVYEKVSTLSGAEEIIVPFVGVRDGLITDLFDTIAFPDSSLRRLASQVNSSCLTLGRKYLFDESHALQVQYLSLSLFDQIHGELGLEAGDRYILSAAALLHDVGSFISEKRHNRHSHYIISHSEIMGLDYRYLQLVAAIARFHRKSEPNSRNVEFACLLEEDQYKLICFAGILRLADSLDREHIQSVKSIKVEDKADKVELQIEANGDFLLEKWSFTKKSQLLSKTLGKPIVIV
jgi:exopolyphosphatase/guanosine-5'-triphosphate,3'-diphosphate pyrophosphatase